MTPELCSAAEAGGIGQKQLMFKTHCPSAHTVDSPCSGISFPTWVSVLESLDAEATGGDTDDANPTGYLWNLGLLLQGSAFLPGREHLWTPNVLRARSPSLSVQRQGEEAS